MARGVYIATVCLSKGAVLHRLLWAFSQEEDMVPASLGACKINLST